MTNRRTRLALVSQKVGRRRILDHHRHPLQVKGELGKDQEGQDEVRDGIRGESDPADDGGPSEAGRGAAEAHLRDAGAVRENKGQLEPPPPPLRLLDLRSLQRPAEERPPDQPDIRPPRPLRRPPP